MNTTSFKESASEYLGITPTILNYIAITFVVLFFILLIILVYSIFFKTKSEKQTLKDGEKMVFKKKLDIPSNILEEVGSKTASSEPTLSDFKQTTIPEYIPQPISKEVTIEQLLQEIKMLKNMLEDKKAELIKKL